MRPLTATTAAQPQCTHPIEGYIIAPLSAVGVLLSCGLAVYLIWRAVRHVHTWKQMIKDYENEVQAKVDEALASARALEFPAHFVPLGTFLTMGEMVMHEKLRSQGCLVIHDTMEELVNFSIHNHIIFISHQWTAFSHPDPTLMQYRVATSALRHIVEKIDVDVNRVWVWLDYCCIPQLCVPVQKLAINSLPLYASSASVFLIVAPPTKHADHHGTCDYVSCE